MRMRTALLPSLLAAALVTGNAAAQAPRTFSGAWILFKSDAVTVVYPAGPGEDVAVNRRSAEGRAAFLQEYHGVRTEVAADDDVSDEQLAGHLLLLGWGNRLLAAPSHPAPLETVENGTRVLGIFDVPNGQDLFFIAASPYASDESVALAFWSRIDPERDRFSVLPFEGSAWAIYDGFRPQYRGMLTREDRWPPRRNPVAEGPAPSPLPPEQARSEHYDLHYPGASISPDQARRVLERRELAWAAVVAALGAPEDPFRIDLYVYPDTDTKEKLSGVVDAAHSEPWDRSLHMVLKHALLPNPHEETHLLARELYGPCYLSALYEGLAIGVEGETRGDDELGVFAAAMHEQGVEIEPDELLDEERFRKRSRQPEGLPAAGLLVGWLREGLGAAEFIRAYTAPSLSISGLATITGDDEAEVRSEHDRWLAARAENATVELEHRRLLEEAKTLRDRSDLAGSARVLERALELKPDDPGTLYRLGMALAWAEDYTAAEARYRRLLELAGASPGEGSWAVLVRFQLGRMFEQQGRTDLARQEYQQALELPDRQGAHARIREALSLLGGAGNEEAP
jgi:tetratricopeptide (TPR) repeat protein